MKLKKIKKGKVIKMAKKKKISKGKTKTVYMAMPKAKRRHIKKHAAKKRRTKRSNVSMPKMKLQNIITSGVAAAAGAGAAILLTNTINKFTKLEDAKKNWLFVGIAVLLGMYLPKVKSLRQFAAPAVTGALSMAFINIASTTFGMKKFFTFAGDQDDEIDKIVSNLNLKGVDLLGMNNGISDNSLLGISEDMSGVDLLGISERMAGMENNDDDEF